ncbi:MAG: BlaI/MecI/CopY family transcriptional regulator [Gemmatimonadota bacterium]
MPESVELSDLQLAIIRVLWSRREASAAEVQAALDRERGLALTTVSTLLTRLEKRGLVGHRSEGRLFLYRSLVTEPEVRRSMLGSLMDSVFQGDPTELVSQLLSTRELSPGDLDRIRTMVEEAQSRRGEAS